MLYVTRDSAGKIRTINKLPKAGREAILESHPDIVTIRQRQQAARDSTAEAAPVELLKRIKALETEVAALKQRGP